jgi:hypothetical protein
MADKKITDMTELAAGSQATGDLVTVVDVSEAAAADKNKKMTMENLFKGIPGDVGIGTSAPDEKLHISATANSSIRLGMAGQDFAYRIRANVTGSVNGGLLIEDAESGNDLYRVVSGASGSHRFFINNSEKVRIDSAGRTLIGHSAAQSPVGFPHLVQIEGTASTTSSLSITRSDTTIGGTLTLAKASGGINQNDAVANGNTLGQVLFNGSNGTNRNNFSARIQAIAAEAFTTSTCAANLSFETCATGATTPTERLRITSSGNVGIGTSSPASQTWRSGKVLDVFGGSGSFTGEVHIGAARGDGVQEVGSINFYDSGQDSTHHHIALIEADKKGSTANKRGGALHFYTKPDNVAAPAERMIIDSSGNVGIGTTSPNCELHVGNSSGNPSIEISRGAVGAEHGYRLFGADGEGNVALKFLPVDNGSVGDETMRIDGSGRLLVGLSSGANRNLLQIQGDVDNGANGVGGISLRRGVALGSIGDGSQLGQLDFCMSDGGVAARILCDAAGSAATDDYPGRLEFWTTADGASSPSLNMTLDSSGRLLIGTTTEGQVSADNLTINDSADCGITIRSGSTSTGAIFFSDGTSGNAEFDGFIEYNQNSRFMRFGTAESERMRIDSSGRLLVGTTSNFNGGRLCIGSGQGTNTPSGEHVKLGPNTNRIEFLDTNSNASDTGSVSLYNTVYNNRSANIELYHPAANTGGIKFETHDGVSLNERMRIRSDGRLYLHGSPNLFISNTASAGTSQVFIAAGHSATDIENSTLSFRVYNNGNVQNTNNSYGAISDSKLKENIIDASSQWDDIKALRVRNYNFIEGQTHTQIGVVAQEVETVSPGLVYESPDTNDDGNELGTVTKSVNYSVLYMKAVKALQEAMARIETLEAKVAALEAGLP